MEWIRQLQEAICFMETHLLEKINYEDVAASVYMSSYSFHRCFSMMAGMTANDYIRQRRLSLAAQELQRDGISVLDAALKYGWETPESFAKAFARFHGITPRQAREPGAALRMFNPLVIKITLEGGTVMDYRIIHKEGQTFLALVRAFPNSIINDDNDHSIPDFWEECNRRKLLKPIESARPEGKRDLYGLCSPKVDETDHFEYGIGILADGDTDAETVEACLKKGFRLWQTETMDYAVFDCMGEDGDCISRMWQKFYHEFLPQSGYEQTECTDYEIYFENTKPGLFCELWIPVKKK